MNEQEKLQFAENFWSWAMVYGPSYWMGIDGWWLDTIDSLKAAGFEQREAERLADHAQAEYKKRNRKVPPA